MHWRIKRGSARDVSPLLGPISFISVFGQMLPNNKFLPQTQGLALPPSPGNLGSATDVCCLFASVRCRVFRFSLSLGIQGIVKFRVFPLVKSLKNTGNPSNLCVLVSLQKFAFVNKQYGIQGIDQIPAILRRNMIPTFPDQQNSPTFQVFFLTTFSQYFLNVLFF